MNNELVGCFQLLPTLRKDNVTLMPSFPPRSSFLCKLMFEMSLKGGFFFSLSRSLNFLFKDLKMAYVMMTG